MLLPFSCFILISLLETIGDYSSPSTEFYGVIADKKVDADSLSSSNVANYFRKLGVLNSSAFEQNGIDGQRITADFLTAQRLHKLGFDTNEQLIILENIPEFRKNPHTPLINRVKRATEEDPSVMVGFKRRMEVPAGYPQKAQKCDESDDLFNFLIADAPNTNHSAPAEPLFLSQHPVTVKIQPTQSPQPFLHNTNPIHQPSPPQSTIQQQLQQLGGANDTLSSRLSSPPQTNNFGGHQSDFQTFPPNDDFSFMNNQSTNNDAFALSDSLSVNLTNPLTGSMVGGLDILDSYMLSIRTPAVDNSTKDTSKDQTRNSLFTDTPTLKDFLSNSKSN